MDTAQWPQGIGVVKSGGENPSKPGEKKPRPQAVNCPRCNSTNTKFCYYNNYSLTQPRYFCKTCRRYWTEGGSLRNVPVGGGSRKNKRSSSSSSSTSNSTPSKKVFPDLTAHNFSPPNPKIHEGHDLNLAYNPSQFNRMSEFVSAPFDGSNLNPDSSASHNHFPVMELFKTGNMASGGFSSLLSGPLTDSNSVYASSGFPVSTEFKPSLGFSENYGNINRSVEEDHTNSSRILFPFEELKPVSNGEFEQDRGGETTNGYWNGMLGSW